MLGICYGHQLMAQHMEGEVEPGIDHEFGRADLRVRHEQPLFAELPSRQRVWMSHGDHVTKLPLGFETLGDTRQCSVAAMGDLRRKYFGLQFHPEVVHSAYGSEILRNFLEPRLPLPSQLAARTIASSICSSRSANRARGRRVLFFLSGGVDSTVAYALTVKALGQDNVHGVYVDTGLMPRQRDRGNPESVRPPRLGTPRSRCCARPVPQWAAGRRRSGTETP